MPESQLKTILLVEDDETSAIVVSKQVKHFGYNVISVNTGEKAVELATSDQNIDLIIMDIVLGEGIDGTTAAKQILAKRKVPIVFLSSHSEKKIVEKVRGISRYGYVLKNSEEFVLQSSIEMAFDLFETHRNVESGIDELKKSEERYRTLFETMAQGVVYQDANEKITSANAAAERILGLTLDQMQGRSSIDPRWRAIHEDGSDFPGDLHPAMVALHARKPVNNVVMGVYHPQTDQQVWININAVPEFRPDETSPFQVYATFDDITERKEVEAAFQVSEAKFRAIFENSRDAIGVSKIGVHVFANPAYLRMFGIESLEKLIGTSIIECIAPSCHAQVMKYVQLRKNGDQAPTFYETRGRKTDGSEFEIEVNLSTYELNAESYTLVTMRDITARKQVEAQNRMMKHSLDVYTDGIYWMDSDNKFVYVNEAGGRAFGCTPEEIIGKSLYDYNPTTSPETLEDLWHKLRTDGTFTTETVHRKLDGSEFFVEVRSVYLQYEGKEYNNGYARDITERKQAEELLKESEFKYRALIENSNDSIFCVDKEGYYKFVNNVFASTFGKTPEYFYGKSFWDIYSKEQADMRFAASSKVFETGKAGSVDVEVPLPDRLLYYIAKTNPIRDPQGNVILNLTIATDITERKKVEEELRESEDKYRGVVEHSPNAIAIYVEGKIVFVNNQCVVLMAAANKEELIGKSVVQFVHPDNRSMVIARKQQVAIDGKPLPMAEEKFIRLDGTSVDVEVRAVPTIYKQKPAVQLIVQDITERKNNEQALRQAQKLESIGTLAGGIAHDFNNLMNAVLGQSALALQKLPKESPAANNIQKAIKAGERVADLTKQLLAYSGRGRFFIDEIDLNKLVKENVAMLEVSIPKTTQLRYELGNPSPHIMGDISQIQQVIMNLIINAGEAMGSHPGFITIHTNRIELPEKNSEYSKYSVTPIAAGSYAMVQVKDNGSGISEETLARIFDPFFTTKFTGRGLGLAAVLGIIKGHKGGLRIESEVGKGTMFEIVWPLVEASTMSNITEKKEIEVNGEGKTILVIDDESTVIELVNDVLSESNFKVMSALDPIKGIELYRQHHQTITMVVLDYSMPHMDGKAAFEKLLEINKEVKVLLCSGYTEEETMSVFGIDRPTGFFHKPYMPDALLERVGEIIAKK